MATLCGREYIDLECLVNPALYDCAVLKLERAKVRSCCFPPTLYWTVLSRIVLDSVVCQPSSLGRLF